MIQMYPARVKVMGPPGTGKTTFLMSLVRQAVESGRYPPGEIAFLSYTTAAAEEARDRIVSTLPGMDAEQFPWFRTLHSACKKLLDISEASLMVGKRIKEFKDSTGFEISASIDAETAFFSSSLTLGDICLAAKSYASHSKIGFRESLNIRNQNTANPVVYPKACVFLRDYERFKARSMEHPQLYDFDDLLLSVLENQIPLGRIRLLIVDEAQDLSPLMFDVVQMWSVSGKIEQTILAGDPYQAIYEFQGAEPKLMCDWQADRSYTLDESFRCPSQVRAASRAIVEKMKHRYPNDDYAPRKIGGFVQKSRGVDLKQLIDSRKYCYWLVRDNHTLISIAAKAKRLGLPYGYVSERKKSTMQGKTAQAISFIQRLRQGAKITPLEYLEITEIVKSKDNLKHGSKALFKKHLGQINSDLWTEAIYDVEDLISLGWTEPGVESIVNGSIWKKLNKEVNIETVLYILSIIDRWGETTLRAKPRLQLGTLHSSKGKESEIVIIDPSFPKMVARSYQKSSDVENRLAYVGVTRAKEGVYIQRPEQVSAGWFYPYPSGPFVEQSIPKNPLDRPKAICEILGIGNRFKQDIFFGEDFSFDDAVCF